MDNVYVLVRTMEGFKPYIKTNDLVKVCKSKESVVRCANEYIRQMKVALAMWSRGSELKCEFIDKTVTEDDLFSRYSTGGPWFEEYVFHKSFDKEGMRKQEWSIHVEEWPVE